MKKIVKLIKTSWGLMINIPRKIIDFLELEDSEYVLLEVDENKLIITKVK